MYAKYKNNIRYKLLLQHLTQFQPDSCLLPHKPKTGTTQGGRTILYFWALILNNGIGQLFPMQSQHPRIANRRHSSGSGQKAKKERESWIETVLGERKWWMECSACRENLPSVTNGPIFPLSQFLSAAVGTQHWMTNPHVCVPRRSRNYHGENFSLGWLHFRTNDLLHFPCS